MKIIWRAKILMDHGGIEIIEAPTLSALKRESSEGRQLGRSLGLFFPPSLKKQISFFREVSQLLTLGLPLTKAISEAPTHFSALVRSLEQGYSLEKALGAARFPPFITSLIAAAQNRGDLIQSLQFLYDFLVERQTIGLQLRKTIVGSGLTLLMGSITACVVLTVLVPQLLPLLSEGEKGMGLKILLWMTEGEEGSLFLASLGVGLGIGTAYFMRILKKELAHASTCQLLGRLLSHGLSLTEALQILLPTSPFLCEVLSSLEKGMPLSESLSLFLKNKQARALLALGVQSQRMAESLLLCAQMMDQRITEILTRVTQAIGPSISLGVGGLLIWIVISVISPLYEKILGIV